jgi:hypothetical protein
MISLVNVLHEKEQDFACELLRKLVVALEPGYTKLTRKEAKELEESEKKSTAERTYRFEDID